MTETNAAGAAREPLPLAGLGVVVTRPAAQAEPMVERLEALGARVVRLPLLAIRENEVADVDVLRLAVPHQAAPATMFSRCLQSHHLV